MSGAVVVQGDIARALDGMMADFKSSARGLISDVLHAQRRGIIRQMESGPHGGGLPLGVRTGNLRRSWMEAVPEITAEGEMQSSGAIGSNLPYALIHDEGGTITPKNGAFLVVPVGEALTAKGVESSKARMYRDGDLLEYVPSRKKGGKVAGRLGYWKAGYHEGRKSGKSEFETLYLLMRSVTITATHYVQHGLDASREKVEQIVDRFMQDVLLAGPDQGAA